MEGSKVTARWDQTRSRPMALAQRRNPCRFRAGDIAAGAVSKVPKPLFRMLVEMASFAYQAGFYHKRLQIVEAEQRASVGKKIVDASRKPRNPSAETVPGVLRQMTDCLTAKPHILARRIQKKGGRFATMTLENITTQIRHFRARARKADSKP